MASAQKRAIFSLVAVIAVLLPSIASANVYFVGDEFGWDLGVSYRSWAKGKTFRVGDKLIFTYVEGNHDVVKVDASGFANCDTTGNSGILSSGNDTITLTSSGKKWYICGFEGHCGSGQKLVITVEPNGAPAPEVSIPWVSVPVAPPEMATPGASAVPKEYSSRKMMMGGAPAPAPTWVVPGFSWVAVPVAPPVVETPGLSLQPDEYAPPAEPLSPSWPPESVPWVPLIPGVPISSPGASAVPKEYSSRTMMMGGAPAPAPTWVVPGFSWVPVPVAPPVVETPGLSLQPDEYAPPTEPLAPSWPPESVPWVPSIPSPEISIPSFPSPSGAPC